MSQVIISSEGNLLMRNFPSPTVATPQLRSDWSFRFPGNHFRPGARSQRRAKGKLPLLLLHRQAGKVRVGVGVGISSSSSSSPSGRDIAVAVTVLLLLLLVMLFFHVT